MNDASRWRLELAQDIADIYAAQPGVQMVIATGSAARGVADAWSDLDLMAYWDEVPDPAWLGTPPLAGTGASRFTAQGSGGGYLEQYRLGALKIDVGHGSVAGLAERIDDVTVRHSTEPTAQKVASGLQHAIALYGAGAYEQHRARVAAYPDALALKMVQQHLFFMPAWTHERQSLDRGDLFGFYDLVCDVVRNLMGVLAGLNRVYYPTHPEPKWTAWYLTRMPLQPDGTHEAITALLAQPTHETIAAFYAVIEATVALVEQHLPAADTTTARAVLGVGMEPCEERPEPD